MNLKINKFSKNKKYKKIIRNESEIGLKKKFQKTLQFFEKLFFLVLIYNF